VNLPWSLPWPSSQTVSRVAASASRSSRSRSVASWASAASGSMTSRIRWPRTLSALASNSAARSTRCRSALVTRPGSSSCGSSARARRMISACSTWSSCPAASAALVRSWPSRPWASRMSRCAAALVVRVRWACQFAVEAAPVWEGSSMRSAWVRTRVWSSAIGRSARRAGRGWRWSRWGPWTPAVSRPRRPVDRVLQRSPRSPGVGGSRSLTWINPRTRHRHSSDAERPLWITGSDGLAVHARWMPRAASSAGSGGLDRLDRRWVSGCFRTATTAGPQPARRRQT
jgi:hypothetical protein